MMPQYSWDENKCFLNDIEGTLGKMCQYNVVLVSGCSPGRYRGTNSIWFDWQVIVESVWVLRKAGPSLRT